MDAKAVVAIERVRLPRGGLLGGELTTGTPASLVVARSAARTISHDLPENVAAAVIEFVTGPLMENPRRTGRKPRSDVSGLLIARRGTYRVLYRVNDDLTTVTVPRIDHRRDVYR